MPLILGTNSIKGGYEVDNSLRFDDGSTNYLSNTFSSAGNQQIMTISFWVKRSDLSGTKEVISQGSGSACHMNFQSSGTLEMNLRNSVDGGSNVFLITNRLFRDVSAWYHIVLALDTTQGTASNRAKLYVNGVQETSFGTETYPSQNGNLYFNEASAMQIGKDTGGANFDFDGYMAEFVFIDGQQLTPTSFGEFDSDSPTIWKPIDVSGLTFGTNGFYLDFEKDESNALFADRSSNPKTVTVAGNVHHSVDQAKFGDTSIEFDGSGDKLTLADTADFDFGTGDFTVEFFAYMSNQSNTYHTIINDPGTNHFRVNLGTTAATPKLTFYSATWDAHTEGTTDLGNEAWHHCAVVRESGTLNIYVDGSREAQRANSTNDLDIGALTIGEYNGGAKAYTGYLDEIRISNTARYTGTSYTVPTASFTSDSNTKLLIQSNASNRLGADVSGQGNHFLTDSGFTSQSQTTDTCTNNFSTMNILDNYYFSGTFSQGNLKIVSDAGVEGYATNTMPVSTGKWYWEMKITSSGSNRDQIGIADKVIDNTDFSPISGNNRYEGYYGYTGNHYSPDTGNVSYGASFTTGDIVGVALDLDNHKLYFHKNGTYQNSGVPTSGSTGTGAIAVATDPHDGVYYTTLANIHNTASTFEANFGNPTFSISSGNSDANGYGNFEYAVPSGYFAICTKNLAEFG